MNLRCVRSTDKGSALIVVLSIIVLLTIILLAAFANVQLSSQLSRSRMDAFAASQFAQDGVERAVALLRFGTADTNANISWLSQPGRITKSEDGTPTAVSLQSGLGDGGADSVNINTPLIRNPSEGVISYDSGTDVMPLRWIYVREDGTRDMDPSYDAANKIRGRYAFWVDDDNSKININTAFSRSDLNTTKPSHPSHISLEPLVPESEETFASAVDTYRKSHHYFNSPLDILKAVSEPAEEDALRQSKFWITHFNHDSDTTLLNKPKIVLTTKADRAGVDKNGNPRPYLNISTDADLAKTVEMLNEYLAATNWPFVDDGESFQKKYFGGDGTRLSTLSLNIIEYVRAKEDPGTDNQGLLIPIRGFMQGNRFVRNQTSSSGLAFRGVNRGLRITEMGIWRRESQTGNTWNVRFFFEVHLPQKYGIERLDLTQFKRYPKVADATGNGPRPLVFINGTNCEPSPPILGGDQEYAVLWFDQEIPKNQLQATATEYNLRFVLFGKGENGEDLPTEYVPLAAVEEDGINRRIAVPVSWGMPLEDARNQIKTTEVDDPVINSRRNDWQIRSSGNSLGRANDRRTVGNTPQEIGKEQDLDINGRITDASMITPPPPPDSTSNEDGMVTSLGELGYIHTGIEAEGSTTAGLPWRTIRLQPRHPSASDPDTLPDWALLDLFALPMEPSAASDRVLEPTSNSRGGRINLNAHVEPFADMKRFVPLRALLKGVEGQAGEIEFEQVSENIYSKTLADASVAKGRRYGSQELFDHIGEVIEVEGVADGGEESEEIVRQIIDLISVRGNVFSVYSIGQSVVQLPNGTIVPRAEERLHSIVERYEELNPDGTLQGVNFRPLFTKSLGL